MSPLVMLILGIAAMFAAFGAIYGTVLVLHDPRGPHWLSNSAAEFAATVLLVTLATVVVGWQIKALIAMGADLVVAIIIVVAMAMACGSTIWRKLNMPERLKVAHRGFSPFGKLRHIRRSKRRRIVGPAFGRKSAGTN